jgi:predicted O-methyltransferase YrrM
MDKLTLDKLPRKVLARLDLDSAHMASRLVVAAERLQLFRKLHRKRLRASEVRRALGVRSRYLSYFLDSLTVLGLLRKSGDRYTNSPLADRYYVNQRAIEWTRLFSAECVENHRDFTVVEELLRTGEDCHTVLGIESEDYVQRFLDNPREAAEFTNMLYHYHQPDAAALAASLDLRGRRSLLDVAGGSGVMSMALADKHSELRVTVLDIEPVCRAAGRLIRKRKLSRRVRAVPGNMHDGLPDGHDVVMLCDTGTLHESVLKDAYEVLPPRGLIVIVDVFFSGEGTDALLRLLSQFTRSPFATQTRKDVGGLLRKTGFRSVRSRNLLRDVWMVTGVKPA